MKAAEVLSLYEDHGYTLGGALESRAAVRGGHPFVLYESRRWAWRDFVGAVTRAAGILERRGVRRGDRLAIVAENSDAHAILLFALGRLGAVLVPINPGFGQEETAYILRHAGVIGVVVTAATAAVVREACAGIGLMPWLLALDADTPQIECFYEALAGESPLARASAVSPDDPLVIIYSSGTTGFPKGVVHSHRTYLSSAEVHLERTRLQPDERVLCALPLYHVNALFYSLGSALVAGASVVIAKRFSASQFWHTIAEHGVTHTTIMVALAGILAARPRSEFLPHKLRVVNGSGFTEETHRIFREAFGVHTIIEGYGMSEIPSAFGNPYEGPRKLASMGLPATHPIRSPWVEVRLLDERRVEVEAGASGELAVRTPNLMLGYYRDPDLTASAFHDGWFMTGDIVRRDEDGYFFFVGRSNDIIRRRGENISGAELDRVIGEHPAVAEAAVIAVDAEFGGDEIMAIVVRRPGAVVEADEVRRWCAEHLSAHKVPRYVVFRDALPHTPTHKVAKHLLKSDPTLRAIAADQ
jgi:crotonobetaine/carnitine-CoA ligase